MDENKALLRTIDEQAFAFGEAMWQFWGGARTVA